MDKIKNLSLSLESKFYKLLNAQVPYLHTAWQAALGALVAGLWTAKSTADVKAVVMVAVATGLAALKATYLKQRG